MTYQLPPYHVVVARRLKVRLQQDAICANASSVTVTGTAGVKESLLGLDSWIATAEEVSLKTASEGGKRRCRRDVLRQTVPNTGCSDWKGPVADS